MYRNRSIGRSALAVLIFYLATPALLPHHRAAQQSRLTQLEQEFQHAYAAIQDRFANGPATMVFPANRRERLRRWQDDLAHSFTRATGLAEQIVNLNPANADMWREHRDTLLVYARRRELLARERFLAQVKLRRRPV